MNYIAIDKAYVENRIAEGKKMIVKLAKGGLYSHDLYRLQGRVAELEDILSQSIEIPVEESWCKLASDEVVSNMAGKFKNGVIIKPKS